MRIAICQIDPIIADLEYNRKLIIDAAQEAKIQGCHLAIFPEMSIIGYPPRDLLEKPAFVKANLESLEKLASQLPDIPVVCGYVERNPKLIGKKVKGILVEDARNLSSLRRRNIRLAVIAVPAEAAQQTADPLVGGDADHGILAQDGAF